MASTSETGHAKNVANFETLINHCTGLGAVYQPSNDALKLTALNPQLLACKAANSAVKVPLVARTDASALRKKLYDELNKLITQLLSMFLLTDALKQEKNLAKTYARKIKGSKNKPPAVPGEDPHSTAQLSFVMRADNFETFIEMLDAEPTYDPAETLLQVASLRTRLTTMRSLNNAAGLAHQALRTVRIARNTALYANETGLVDTAMEIKKYLKAAFGTSHTNYKDISGLQFKKLEEDPNA